MKETELKIAISQIAPVWLNKQQTTFKNISQIDEAGIKGCDWLFLEKAYFRAILFG